MQPRDHWEEIYRTKSAKSVSWYQPEASVSLDLIRRVAPGLQSPILDVGGGPSTLVDGLLDTGYEHVSVLDIAASALAIARARLGERANKVKWIESDVLRAPLPKAGFVWHDRAVFHFLTDGPSRALYVAKVREAVQSGFVSIPWPTD